MTKITTERSLRRLAVAAALGLAAVACTPEARNGRSANAPTDQPPTVTAAPAGTVTFDESTCSMEITADRIESGRVLFDVVNATEKRAMFDSYQLSEGYTVRAFATTIERDRRRAEPWIFPSESEVSYLSSEIIPANSSGSVDMLMSQGSRHAIVCMQPYKGEVMDVRPFGIAGPIVVR